VARLRDAHARDRGDPVRPALVVVQVVAERLLEAEALDVLLQARPAGEAELPRELELRVGELDLLAGRTALTHTFLGLLAQLLEAELNGHCKLPSVVRGVRLIRLERKHCAVRRNRGWARPLGLLRFIGGDSEHRIGSRP
jgi:hypothetical protein